MEKLELLSTILDNLNLSVVFVDTEHVIRYMNSTAQKQYARFGNIIGKSIFDCHNKQSGEMIKNIFNRLLAGETEVMYFENAKRKVYMTGVRDRDGRLIGYYERYEYIPNKS